MTTPYPYQREGIERIKALNGTALLADEMGLGKSIQAITAAYEGGWGPIIIVCPKTLKENWKRECKMHLGMDAEILEGKHDTIPGLRKGKWATILNYEIQDSWRDYILAKKPGLIIFDEGHKLCNRNAQRYKAARRLVEHIPRRLILTGTPIVNNIGDMYGLYCIMYPEINSPGEYEINQLKNVTIRRLKKNVLDQLPKITNTVVPLHISNRKEYEFAFNDFLNWLKIRNPKALAGAERAEALVRVGYLKRLCADGKIEGIRDWLDDNSFEKVILFAIHRKIIYSLSDYGVTLTGDMTQKQRVRAIDTFTLDDRCRVLIANIDIGGLGWNGTVASHAAMIELPWVPHKVTQAAARIHRIGQKFPANVYHILGKNTIEERVCEILMEKQEISDSVLDGGIVNPLTNVFQDFLSTFA